MDNLRLILLIIGCLVVLGIYLWEVFYKGTPRKRNDILNAVDSEPDSPISTTPTNEVAIDNFTTEALADLGSLLASSKKEIRDENPVPDSFTVSNNIAETSPILNDKSDESDEPLALEMSVRDYEAKISDDESNVFAAIEEDLHALEEAEVASEIFDEEELDVPESNKASDDILVLYITSPSHISFNGLLISKAADEVGMIYGHMNVFHHFGPGKLHSGQPLFSLANMHEPGSFDLGRMADLKTKGLAVFMYSPASIDAGIVFELFLNTTQRLAEILGGAVRTSDMQELNNNAINSLREKAESLSAHY